MNVSSTVLVMPEANVMHAQCIFHIFVNALCQTAVFATHARQLLLEMVLDFLVAFARLLEGLPALNWETETPRAVQECKPIGGTLWRLLQSMLPCVAVPVHRRRPLSPQDQRLPQHCAQEGQWLCQSPGQAVVCRLLRYRDTHLVLAQGALHTRIACGGVLLEDSPKTAPIAKSVLRIGAASAHGAMVAPRTRVAAMSL